QPLLFSDSRGKQSKVHAFGILKEDGVDSYRTQVQVLFKDGVEFALDLSSDSKPYQIVVARMERKATLKATLEHLDQKIVAFKGKDLLGDGSVLLVPTMNWRIDQRFRNLENKPFLHLRGFLSKADQFIHFKMDRKGAEVVSGANLIWAPNGHVGGPETDYIFDRPYLLLLKKRG